MRRDGYSFCIMADGKRQAKLDRLITSIQEQRVSPYEIIVAGVAHDRPDIRHVALERAARNGRVNTLRNAAAKCSQYSHLVFVDDDIILTSGWLCTVARHRSNACVSTRLLNIDGTRHWDRASSGGPRGLVLLDYDEEDPYVYMTGGLLTMDASVWERIPWDEALGYGEAEDVTFSRAVQRAGLTCVFCKEAFAVHDDHRYTQIGRKVPRRTDSAATAWLENRFKGLHPGEMGLRGLKELKAGNLTDAVDCLRYALHVYPGYESAARLLALIEQGCGGPVDAGLWQPVPVA